MPTFRLYSPDGRVSVGILMEEEPMAVLDVIAEGNKQSCVIICEAAKKFCVNYIHKYIRRARGTESYGLKAVTFLDGVKRRSDFWAEKVHDERNLAGVRIGPSQGADLMFGELTTTEEDELDPSNSKLIPSQIGTITIKYYRGIHSGYKTIPTPIEDEAKGKAKTEENYDDMIRSVPEKKAKGGLISNLVKAGKPYKISTGPKSKSKTQKILQFKRTDKLDEPFIVFEFRYMNEDLYRARKAEGRVDGMNINDAIEILSDDEDQEEAQDPHKDSGKELVKVKDEPVEMDLQSGVGEDVDELADEGSGSGSDDYMSDSDGDDRKPFLGGVGGVGGIVARAGSEAIQ